MAKVNVVGRAIVVTSSLKMSELEMVKKYRPNELVLKGGEDGKEPIFMLDTGDGSVSKFGISFEDEARETGLASLTLVTDYEGDNLQQYIVDELGSALVNLGKLEEKLPAVITEIEQEQETILANITITA